MSVRKITSTVNRVTKAAKRAREKANQAAKRAREKAKQATTPLSPGQKRTSKAALGHPATKRAKGISALQGAGLGAIGTGVGITALQTEDNKDTASKGSAKFRKSKRVKRGNYKIKRGDTLSEIARDHNTTVAALMKANPSIKDKDMLYAGDTIIIPSVPFPTRSRPKSKDSKSSITDIKNRRTVTKNAGGGKISSSIPSNRRSRG
jgi:LysM repeat protein